MAKKKTTEKALNIDNILFKLDNLINYKVDVTPAHSLKKEI